MVPAFALQLEPASFISKLLRVFSLLVVFLVGQRVIQHDPKINWVTVMSDTLAIEEH